VIIVFSIEELEEWPGDALANMDDGGKDPVIDDESDAPVLKAYD